ncbi:DUF3349 domain-containing protein [Arthrobacter sp. NPDC090010]|uniref:DUF3349 domain-containing protein n=1 Tax=Arthrobacter sp. NPDC090010 TaxID=3363942 RepID=UPI0038240942
MSGGLAASVLNWLREGYPDGVPPKDYHPLLALLRRSVPEDQYGELAARLEQECRQSPGEGSEGTTAEPAEADVRLVASRLALAGWPLGRLEEVAEPAPEERPGLLSRIVSWLRAGYPQGVPATDYVPLLALLRRRLSEEEAAGIAAELIADGEIRPDGTRAPIARLDAQVLISKVLHDLPADEDVQRVGERLKGNGWPLDD